MILDAGTLMPAPEVETLVRGARERELPGLLKTELHASVVELNTGICVTGQRRSTPCARCAARPRRSPRRTTSSSPPPARTRSPGRRTSSSSPSSGTSTSSNTRGYPPSARA